MRLARRIALAVAGLAMARGVGLSAAAPRAAEDLTLVPPRRGVERSLMTALSQRRSVRTFAAQALKLADLSDLLWAAQGISGAGGLRTAPSAGALYPLELHVAARRVDGLAAGVYRYAPSPHVLAPGVAGSVASELTQAAGGQAALSAAPAVLAIAAVHARTAAKYGARAGRYVAFEAGAAAQNIALQAASLGLGTVVIGAFDDAAVARILRLPPGEEPVALMPVGWPG